MNINDILIQPVTTEKSTKESSQAKYTFIVNQNSTKIDIKKAIQKLYGLEVDIVRIVKIQPKYRTGAKGHQVEKRISQKKAIITLKDKKKTLDVNKFAKGKE
ncbi:50S ribosomal protein L23 [Candidatus Peregrinibacteria bacterium]|nr:50S ribosomal protein L23 [Candidatus Peregrinibacteria bacterium]